MSFNSCHANLLIKLKLSDTLKGISNTLQNLELSQIAWYKRFEVPRYSTHVYLLTGQVFSGVFTESKRKPCLTCSLSDCSIDWK